MRSPEKERLIAVIVALLSLATAGLAYGEDLNLPLGKIAAGKPETMMKHYWLRQVAEATRRWQASYEARKTPDEIAAYQARLRGKFLEAIGGLPERTPLNPQVTGTVRRDGYRVERIIFESQPKHFVTAILFLPEASQFVPPYPGVVVPCGHAVDGKGYKEYQAMGALLALNGLAALVFDPIDQGERGQCLGPGGWPALWGTKAHSLVGVGSTLLGRNTARFEIWDAMRAVDYLQSRKEVDARRIGCTGNSGGGTQTSYMMALDDRIAAAAPSCYLCGFPALLATKGPQDSEQNIFGQLAFGMDHADYLMMRAPTPILVCAATQDFFDIRGTWDCFRSAKRLYTRMGAADRVAILENDARHNYNELQRAGAAQWLVRWLAGRATALPEPTLALLTEIELQCTPEGQVMRLPGARSVYDLNEDYENQLARRRAESWKSGDRGALADQVRQLAGIRRLNHLPKPQAEELDSVTRPGYRIEKIILRPEEGIALPALIFRPDKSTPRRIVLYINQEGKGADAAPGDAIERLVLASDLVLAVDLCGIGQTRPSNPDWDVGTAYLLGRSYVGLRAEDILIAARYAQEQFSIGRPEPVHLIAVGQVGIAALHAAALEPGLFESVKLTRTLSAWSDVIHSRLTHLRPVNIVHGALTVYDLPDLAAILGPKLTIEQPVDGLGQDVRPAR